jgi:hypothetical protein
MTDDEQREPFPRWVIRYVTVPVLIALIGLVGVLVVGRNGGEAGPSTTAATPTTAAPTIVVPPARGGAEVRACMAQHQLPRTRTTVTTTVAPPRYYTDLPEVPDDVTIIKRCDWPPITGADSDGYSEITVRATHGPGEGTMGGTNVADIIKSNCSVLRLTYKFVAQGYQEPLPPIVSPPDREIHSDGRGWRGEFPFIYEHDELVVLRNTRLRLDAMPLG